MNERDDDWKQDVLEDFRRWLAGVTEEEAGAADHEPPECDLRDLFAELAALRQEVRLRNREQSRACLLYTSPSPRDGLLSRMPSSA